MQAAIIVPARLQSTRFPNKMLKRETGIPLICHTALTAAAIRDRSGGDFVKVMVAADSNDVKEAVDTFSREHGLGIDAVLTDPNHQSGSDRIAEAAATLPRDITAVCNLQGDEPDIPVDSVLALSRFFKESQPDIATMVYPLTAEEDKVNPALVKAVLGVGGNALYFSRATIPFHRETGSFSPPTYGHVGIYFYQRSALERFVSLPPGALEQTEKLEQLRALENGMRIAAYVLDQRPPKGIDTAEDYADFVRKVRQTGSNG